jgi:hypothetical protein
MQEKPYKRQQQQINETRLCQTKEQNTKWRYGYVQNIEDLIHVKDQVGLVRFFNESFEISFVFVVY